jgi:hypothetical protein
MAAKIRNTQKWSNWDAVFYTRSVRLLRDAAIQELLGQLFSVPSVPRLSKGDQLLLRERVETAVRRVGVSCETVAGQ